MKIEFWYALFLDSLRNAGLNLSDVNSLSNIRILGTEKDGDDALALSSVNISKRQMKNIYKMAKEGRLYVQSENNAKERRFLEVSETDNCSFANPQPRDRTEASSLLDKAAYMETINKLFKDVTDTNFLFSLDSKAYKNARASILAIQKTLNNTPAENFTLDLVQSKMESITMLANQYMKTHETNRSNRQERRYKAFSELAKFNKYVDEYHKDTADFDNKPKQTAPKEEPKEKAEIPAEEKELNQYISLIEKHKGWTSSEKIPEKLKYGGTVEELENFRKNNNLSKGELEFIDMRIAAEKYFAKYLENKVDPVRTNVEIKEDGSCLLPEIKQDEFQSSQNGCYSCAMKLLMQGQGINISQKQIRAYHGDQGQLDGNFRALGDNMGNIFELGGLLVSKAKNTGICEANFSGLDKNTSPEKREAAKKSMIDLVKKSITQYHSPVALMKGAHYMTIVGYDAESESFICKNSYNPLGKDPNKNELVPVNDLTRMKKVHFTYAFPIDPKDPTKELTGCSDVEFVNGRFLETSMEKVGLVDNYNYPDSRFMMGSIRVCEGVAISTSYKVPMEMEIPPEMIVPGVNDLKIKPAKDDPQKQELISLIDQEISTIFPTDQKLTVTSGNKLDKIRFLQNTSEKKADDFTNNPRVVSVQDFARYIYLRRVKDNMDEYTPFQAKRALREDVRAVMEKNLYQNRALISMISAYQPRPGKTYSATPEEMYSAFTGYAQLLKDYSKIEKMTNAELKTYQNGIEQNMKNAPGEKKFIVMNHEVKKIITEREKELQKSKGSMEAKETAPEKQQATC